MFILEPGSRVKKASKNLSIFNPKNCFQALGNMIRDVYPGPDLDFYPSRISDPGVKKATDQGSRIHNTCWGRFNAEFTREG
jgi:hypothetical protein